MKGSFKIFNVWIVQIQCISRVLSWNQQWCNFLILYETYYYMRHILFMYVIPTAQMLFWKCVNSFKFNSTAYKVE